MKTSVVYLLHFDRPFYHAQHYLGSTANLPARLAEHSMGTGSPLLAAVSAAGISWQLVRLWPGDRSVERQLKRRKNARALCPYCRTSDNLAVWLHLAKQPIWTPSYTPEELAELAAAEDFPY